MENKLISLDDAVKKLVKEYNKLLSEYEQRKSSNLFIIDQMNWERPEFDDVA